METAVPFDDEYGVRIQYRYGSRPVAGAFGGMLSCFALEDANEILFEARYFCTGFGARWRMREFS